MPHLLDIVSISAALLLLYSAAASPIDGESDLDDDDDDLVSRDSRARRDEPSFVKYYPGTGLPLILSAPHGGYDEPSTIRDRTPGCLQEDGKTCTFSHDCEKPDKNKCKVRTARDGWTRQLTEELRTKLCDIMGACPAAILNNLSRKKFDANREFEEATFNEVDAVEAYNLYHEYIGDAVSKISGDGLLLDIHGHSHKTQRAELGYIISKSQLAEEPFDRDPVRTSLRSLASRVEITFEELVRGNQSFGGFLQSAGYPAVPSPENPDAGTEKFFSGGYLTQRYGSRDGGSVDAIQIESAKSHRVNSGRPAYVAALATAIKDFLNTYYMTQQ